MLDDARRSPVAEEGAVDTARLLGRLDGEGLERTLRAVEARERADRLGRLLIGDETYAPLPAARASSGIIHALRNELASLTTFYHAVQRSRVWAVAQLLRRPLGRAW
ncbi:MAG TPA: hypothetical protein VHQ90_11055 [Thermoanaerobaculia bacterium]|nr:hypothetical protein [Thermoanaerobaculia bacterium]